MEAEWVSLEIDCRKFRLQSNPFSPRDQWGLWWSQVRAERTAKYLPAQVSGVIGRYEGVRWDEEGLSMEREIHILSEWTSQEVGKLTLGPLTDEAINDLVAALKIAFGAGHRITEVMRRTHCGS